ncbi:MAG: bifunctional nicotinamidase/pyrazinamidase [Planctomycetota bacterium]
MDALILVDLQYDFMPGGALPVPHGHDVVPIANRVQPAFDLVLATQDWHPPDHGSFAAQHAGRRPGDVVDLAGLPQILWPVHCVQHTPGAALVAELDKSRIERVFHKGVERDVDSYSAFFDNAHRRSTGLGEFLRAWRSGSGEAVRALYILGLATDYCVKYSVLDARGLGFETHVIADGCRGVNLQPGDSERALEDVQRAGAIITTSRGVLAARAARPAGLPRGTGMLP